MGILDKVKNLFTEEVEESVVKKDESKKHGIKREIPKQEIQKQERKVEIAPARRETTSLLNDIDSEIKEKTEEKSVLPIYFSDDAFEDLEKPKEKTREEHRLYREIYKDKREEKTEEKKENKKIFKPSPIISPVYGVLDKNYKKDDISTKEVPISNISTKVTIDDVRNKAYGTLEEELESNLLDHQVIVSNENNDETGINIFEELENKELDDHYELHEEQPDIAVELERQKQKIEEINEIIKNNVSKENKKITSRKIDNILEELDEIEELIPDTSDEEIKEENQVDSVEKKDSKEDNIDNSEKTDNIVENLNINEENEDTNDELEEGDLFNLIDSMYEKRDE